MYNTEKIQVLLRTVKENLTQSMLLPVDSNLEAQGFLLYFLLLKELPLQKMRLTETAYANRFEMQSK